MWPGRFLKKKSSLLAPGAIQKRKKEKKTHLSCAHSNGFGLSLGFAQEILLWWRGLGLQMVRALNMMWALDAGAAVPGDWT